MDGPTLRVCSGRLLSLLGRTTSMAGGPGCPLPVAILHIASQVPGTWAYRSHDMCSSLDAPLPSVSGVFPGAPQHHARRWFDSHILRPLESALRSRVLASASALTTIRLPLAAISVNSGPHPVIYGRGTSPDHARLWGLARWGHDPFPGGRSARHSGLPTVCSFCSAPVGDILHCLSECSMFEDLRAQWCLRCAIPPQSGPQWTRHPWLFDCSCPLNSPGLIRAHISISPK